MAKTFEELKSQANLIKNETKTRANTASRVGGTIFDMVEKVEDADTEAKKLIKGQSENTDPKTDPHKWIDEINVDEEGEKELKALLDGMASREGVGFYRGSFSGSLFEVETIAVSYDDGNYTQSVRGSLSISSDGISLQYGSTYKILTRVCTGNKWSTWRDLAQPDSMPISGFVNLTEVKAYNTLTTTAKALANNTMKYYLITDSIGKLPSLKGETKITMYSTVGKLFHPSQSSVGASVGDIAVIAKINNVAVYYVQPRYEAKAPSGDFPGCDGLMSAGDKQNLTNALNNSNTAIKQIDQSCFRCYNGTYNANNCFWYGYYMYVNFGRPAGSEDGENYLLRVADIGKTSDNKFVIEQTLYSSKYATKIFRRIIIVTDKRGPADASNVVYTEWERVGSGANVVQGTGGSEKDVMSQKAVTNELNLKLNKVELKNLVDGYIGDIDLIKSISVLEDYVINLEEGKTLTLVNELNKPEFPVRKQLYKYAIGKIIIQETGYGDRKHTYNYWFIPVNGSHMGYSGEAVPFNVYGGVLFVCEPVIQSSNPNANLRIYTGAASYKKGEDPLPDGDLIKDLVFSEYKIKSSNVVQVTGGSEEDVMSQKAVTDELNKKQDTLKSGENIKTINGQSILGSGDFETDHKEPLPQELAEIISTYGIGFSEEYFPVHETYINKYLTEDKIYEYYDVNDLFKGFKVVGPITFNRQSHDNVIVLALMESGDGLFFVNIYFDFFEYEEDEEMPKMYNYSKKLIGYTENDSEENVITGRGGQSPLKTINGETLLGEGDIAIAGSGVNVVQNTGQSETDVMSQKAVTDNLKSYDPYKGLIRSTLRDDSNLNSTSGISQIVSQIASEITMNFGSLSIFHGYTTDNSDFDMIITQIGGSVIYGRLISPNTGITFFTGTVTGGNVQVLSNIAPTK